jgi:hypothetical protein
VASHQKCEMPFQRMHPSPSTQEDGEGYRHRQLCPWSLVPCSLPSPPLSHRLFSLHLSPRPGHHLSWTLVSVREDQAPRDRAHRPALCSCLASLQLAESRPKTSLLLWPGPFSIPVSWGIRVESS